MSAYFLSRLAWSCLYQADAWNSPAFAYGGKRAMHWCKREVKWAADYLMKAHIKGGQIAPYPRTREWSLNDEYVVMVRPP